MTRPFGLFSRGGLSTRFSLIVATWFGLGYLPKGPGTWGTLGTIPVILLFNYFEWTKDARILFWIALFVLGWICTRVYCAARNAEAGAAAGENRDESKTDPKEVVIDEVLGFLLIFLFVEISWYYLIAGFAAFRFFDILKPWPIRALDRAGKKFAAGTWAQSLFVILDDLLAGLATVFALYAGLFAVMFAVGAEVSKN